MVPNHSSIKEMVDFVEGYHEGKNIDNFTFYGKHLSASPAVCKILRHL